MVGSSFQPMASRPSRARELKPVTLYELGTAPLSRPSRARELKRLGDGAVEVAAVVAPLAGA